MKNEKDVKKAVKEILDEAGAWYFMPVANGFTAIGIPDFIGCLKGKFIAIETKFGSNKPTRMQEIILNKIKFAGGVALVIRETEISMLRKLLCGKE